MSVTASLSIVANKVVALSVISGANGLSAYQIAVANGFVGNESAWLATLLLSDQSLKTTDTPTFQGLLLPSPDGNRWLLTIDNSGQVSVTEQ